MKENYIFLLLIVSFIALMSGCTKRTILNEPPNILWITSEDMNAFIGAFGDSLANTPHLDQLAKDGVRYTHTFATAPVCSPSRSCLITGIYATSFGTQHLRSVIDMPSEVVPYPKYLRQAGYYCTNQGKDDYNFVDSTIWDENSNTAHWRNRKEGQPFFSVFNIMTTHQSQIFGTDEVFEKKYGQQLDDNQRKDPVEINVPPYHFDTPVVRKLWARYYDLVTLMDREVGAILSQLEQDGLLENTIVFYYSDHGTGMPRSKRALYDSGLRVPLIIKAPKRWRKQLNLITGSIKEDMVSFVDFAPTLLNLCQIEIPDQMQGIAFLGDGSTKQEYVFGHSDRVDEAYELSRTIRNHRYRYVRNFLPHLPLIQDNFYTDQSEIMIELRDVLTLGELNDAQAMMWKSKRYAEELYDTQQDPYEINNLAQDDSYQSLIEEFRRVLNKKMIESFDTGLMHEIDMAEIGQDQSIYKAAQDTTIFPIEDILKVIDGQVLENWNENDIHPSIVDPNKFVRFWAIKMLEIKEWQLEETKELLLRGLDDEFASIRIAASRAILKHQDHEIASNILLKELRSEDKRVRLTAARAIEQFIDKRSFDKSALKDYYGSNCPQTDWSKYYNLYTCWSLDAAIKNI